eukprot:COSAG02_NODE_17341_length_1011_cov_0.794956_1_plen_86_part_10
MGNYPVKASTLPPFCMRWSQTIRRRAACCPQTLVLVTILSGGNLPLGLIYFFFMWWAEMLGWGCYFNMAHGPPPPPTSHGDCAGLD